MSFSSKVTTETERLWQNEVSTFTDFPILFLFRNEIYNRVKGNDSRRRTTTQDYIYFVRFPSVAGLQKIVWGVLIQQSSIFGQRNKKRKSLEIPVPVHRGRGNENLRFLLSWRNSLTFCTYKETQNKQKYTPPTLTVVPTQLTLPSLLTSNCHFPPKANWSHSCHFPPRVALQPDQLPSTAGTCVIWTRQRSNKRRRKK